MAETVFSCLYKAKRLRLQPTLPAFNNCRLSSITLFLTRPRSVIQLVNQSCLFPIVQINRNNKI